MAGPTVGADSSIDAVTDGGGLGASSLTPDGQLIWNQPGYVNFQGTGLTPVPLTPTRLYFAEDVVPGCTGFGEGLKTRWIRMETCSGAFPSGYRPHRFAVMVMSLAHDLCRLRCNADVSRDWAFDFRFSSDLIGPSVAPGWGDSISFTPIRISGRLLRLGPEAVGVYASRAVTSPKGFIRIAYGSVVVFPTFPLWGKMVAAPAHGSVLSGPCQSRDLRPVSRGRSPSATMASCSLLPP